MDADATYTLSPVTTLRRSNRTAWQRFDQEWVVMNVPARTLLGLNKLAGRIWDQLDGTRSLNDIASTIAEVYRRPVQDVQQDVVRFAQSLLDRGCVEVVTP